MMRIPRVAFFSDSFHEVNGLALTSRQFESFARRRQLPFFSVHAGPYTAVRHDAAVTVFELQRSAVALNLEATSELSFDPLLWRHRHRLVDALRAFQPELLHITGPGDVGMLGVWIAHELRVPLAASWHTNLHEYAGLRLEKMLSFLPRKIVKAMSAAAEHSALTGSARFYALARVLFAPNRDLVDFLRERSGKPCFLMQRGVNSELFHPSNRDPGQRPFTIGYTGRLTVEKNVRFLATIERALIDSGATDYRFLVIGPGCEEAWLRTNLRRAEFPGVLKGDALARAYANMDLFVFPSRTDTFGNVVLEALASGVPAIVTASGGPRFLVRPNITGFVAADECSFTRAVVNLFHHRDALERMRLPAREYACSLSWDRVFERVYEAYESVSSPEAAVLAAS